MNKTIKIFFSLGLFLFFSHLLYSEITNNIESLKIVYLELKGAWLYILGAILAFYVSIAIRAWRWSVILAEKNAFWISYRSISIGFLVQIPLSKIGEIVRITNQMKYLNKNKGAIISTVFVDRLFDIISLGIILFLTILFSGSIIERHFPEFSALIPKFSFLILIGIIASCLAMILNKKILSLIEKCVFLPEPFHLRLISFYKQFMDGLNCLQSAKIVVMMSITSIILWMLYFLSYIFIIYYFKVVQEALDFSGLIFSFTCSALGAVIPVPGAVAYPLAVQKSIEVLIPNVDVGIAVGIGTACYFLLVLLANTINGLGAYLYQLLRNKND